MKKKTSLLFLILPLVLFCVVRFNLIIITQTIDNIFEYIFYWFVCLFILSLLAWKLEESKYKNWLKTSLIVVLISVYWGYKNDLTGNSIVDIDGELTTIWLLSAYSLFSIIYFIKNFIKSRKVNTK